MPINSALQFPVQTGDGQTTAIVWTGGRGVFTAWGTFGGGTVTLQWSPDSGVTWMNVDRSGDTFTTFTSNGTGGFELGSCSLRCSLAGSTAPNIKAGLEFAFR